MTERSYFWDGLVTGDASLAPYSASTWNDILEVILQRTNNQGIVDGLLDELVVAGVSGGVTVASGNAINSGSFYENTASLSVSIPTPVSNPRIDRIVVRKDWGLQTIRITRIAGTENASPTAPALVQNDNSQWDVPLAQVRIETTGVLAVTDERISARTKLALSGIGWVLIETFDGDGVETEANFTGISANFKHLMIVGMSDAFTISDVRTEIDGDVAGNYNRQSVRAGNVLSTDNDKAITFFESEVLNSSGFGGGFFIIIPNYSDVTLFKNLIASSIGFTSVPVATSIFGGGIHVNAFTAIGVLRLFLPAGAAFATGVKISLYGLL